MKSTPLFATFALFSLLGVGWLSAAPNDDLLFYAPFDGETTAAVARGNPEATHAIEPRFEPGIRGQALVVGGDPEMKQRIEGDLPVGDKTPRHAVYQPEGNLDLQQGTLSFWVKSLDWRGMDKGFNVLFYAHAGRNYFQVYKFFTGDQLLLLVGEQEKWTSVEFKLRDWEPGQWQHVAVTWSPEEMRMLINGHLVCRRQVRFPLRDAEGVEPFSVGPGGAWSKAFIGHSLVDEFRIYRRPLSLEEIQAIYLADASAVEHDSGMITLGEATPRHDGRIEEGEYTFDSTGLAAPGQPLVSPENSRYAMSYDRERLYLAALTQLKPDAANVLDLHLSSSLDRIQTLRFHPDGRVFDAATGAAMETVQVGSSVEDGLWLLEAAVPFDALGESRAPDGDTWRMNLVRRYGDEMVSLAPVVGEATNRAHFIALVFRADAPRIRIGNWANAAEQQSAQFVKVEGADERSVVRLDYISDTTEDYGLKSHGYVVFADGRPKPYQSPVWRGGGSAADLVLNETRIVETRDGRSVPLYIAKSIAESGGPLKVFYLYTHDKRQLVVSSQRRAEGAMRVRFLRPDGGEAWRAEQALPPDTAYFDARFDLDFKVLIPGYYDIAIDYVAPGGEAVEVWSQAYVVPGPEHPAFHPYVDPEADQVPAPWTPVEITGQRPLVIGQQSLDGGKIPGGGEQLAVGSERNPQSTIANQQSKILISTWGRTYGFGEGLLFDSLVSQGEEILAAPAVLRLNGTNLVPVAPAQLTCGAASGIRADLSNAVDLGALRAQCEIRTHFDGYSEVALTLMPTDGATLEVGTLSLDVPLRASAATLVRDHLLSQLIGGKSGAVGDAWHQGFASEKSAFLWVGNDRVGFNWMAPDFNGWQCRDKKRHVELIRQAETVILRFNLVDSPLTLDAPRTICFGFALTPTRPLDHKTLRRREHKEYQMWCQPWKYFAVPEYETASIDGIRNDLARVEPGADEVFLYFGVGLTSPFVPEWAWFVEEWLGSEGEYGKRTGSFSKRAVRDANTYTAAPISVDSFYNWMQHTRAAFFEKAKTPLIPEAHSYYFDTGASVSDRYREQALNVYRMIRRTGPEARVYIHHGWTRVMPMQHFADIFCGGEGVEGLVLQKGNYYDLLTPEMFRATFSPYLWGMKMVFLDMNVRALRQSDPGKLLAFDLQDPETRRPLLHSYGYCIAHDVDIHDPNIESKPLRETIWAAQDALGWDEDVIFHPYWENDTVKRLGDDIGRIMASAYTKDGRMILAVLNDTDEAREIELELDLDALGVEAGGEGVDVWDPERTYVLGEHWRDTVPPRGFRMVLWK